MEVALAIIVILQAGLLMLTFIRRKRLDDLRGQKGTLSFLLDESREVVLRCDRNAVELVRERDALLKKLNDCANIINS